MTKIKAFGKYVSREQAYKIIIYDKICEIHHAGNTDALENLLMNGWTALTEWTDEDLEAWIYGLCVENQPNKKFSN